VVNEKGEIVGVISAMDFLWVAEVIGRGGKERSLT